MLGSRWLPSSSGAQSDYELRGRFFPMPLAHQKIRKLYDDYMLNFQKDREALDSFEDRYISAMRARMGLDLFLHAERTVVEELIQKEEKKTRDESERLNTVKQESE